MNDEANRPNIPTIVISDEDCPLPDSTMPDSTIPESADTEGGYVTDENNWILISDTSNDAIIISRSKKKKGKSPSKNKNRSSGHGFKTATMSKARKMKNLKKVIGTRPNKSTLQKTERMPHRSGNNSFVTPTDDSCCSNMSTQNNGVPPIEPTVDILSTPEYQFHLNTSMPFPACNLNGGIPSPLPRKPIDLEKRFQIKPSDTTVAIGSGHTRIDRFHFQLCDWSCYRAATNKLLIAVFGKKVLATHSLTGKASPAFKDKVRKKKLDSKKVADIIMTVSEVCNVKENLVRSSISTKCASEFKLRSIRKAKKSYLKTLRENIVMPDSQTADIEDQVQMIQL